MIFKKPRSLILFYFFLPGIENQENRVLQTENEKQTEQCLILQSKQSKGQRWQMQPRAGSVQRGDYENKTLSSLKSVSLITDPGASFNASRSHKRLEQMMLRSTSQKTRLFHGLGGEDLGVTPICPPLLPAGLDCSSFGVLQRPLLTAPPPRQFLFTSSVVLKVYMVIYTAARDTNFSTFSSTDTGDGKCALPRAQVWEIK